MTHTLNSSYLGNWGKKNVSWEPPWATYWDPVSKICSYKSIGLGITLSGAKLSLTGLWIQSQALRKIKAEHYSVFPIPYEFWSKTANFFTFSNSFQIHKACQETVQCEMGVCGLGPPNTYILEMICVGRWIWCGSVWPPLWQWRPAERGGVRGHSWLGVKSSQL